MSAIYISDICAVQQQEPDSPNNAARQEQHGQQQDCGAALYIFECCTCTRWFVSVEDLLEHTKRSYSCAAKLLQQAALKGFNIAETSKSETCERRSGSSSVSLQHQEVSSGYTTEPPHDETQHSAKGMSAAESVPGDCQLTGTKAPKQHEQYVVAHVETASQEGVSETHMRTVSTSIPDEPPVVQPSNVEDLTMSTVIFQSSQGDQSFSGESNSPKRRDHSRVCTDDSPWSMYPELHADVFQRLAANGLSIDFCEEIRSENSIQDYDTNIMGVFSCSNLSCPIKDWKSRKVSISIRMYNNKQYNAIVWHQRCRDCKGLGDLELDAESYTERIAYRLGKWLGLRADVPFFPKNERDDIDPHIKELCEGCKNGHCPERHRRRRSRKASRTA